MRGREARFSRKSLIKKTYANYVSGKDLLMTPAQQLKRLRVSCDTGVLPADLGDWLGGKLDRYFQGNASLDACLGAKCQSGGFNRQPWRVSQLEHRDSTLSLAAQWLCPDGTTMDQANALADALARFRPLRPPGYPPDVHDLLAGLFGKTLILPLSPRQLYRILSGDRSG